MRVLHILNTGAFSGAENVACQIISLCQSEAVEFVYCSLDGQVRDSLNERGIFFVPVSRMSVSELRRVIKEVNPDVIHAHDMRAGFFSALSCGKIPLVLHVHNNAYDSRGISLKSILFYFAAKKAKHIFWVSQSSFNGYVFHKVFEKKSTVLYNIINIEMLKQKMSFDVNTYDYDVVYLGRLTHPKNPRRLIEVISKIVSKRPSTRVAIIGTGELETEIKKLSTEKRLDNNVNFLGFQRNPSKMLHDSKVMLMTSLWEGTPMCALEAMALGVPIVTTPTDGLCDLVEENVTGYLSDEDDSLVEKCLDIICNEDLHTRLSQASMRRASELMDSEVYKSEIINAYLDCRGNGR